MNPSGIGQRVVVHEFSEDPATAIEQGLSVVEMTVPSVDTLGARDVLIAVRSAQVGWVDLLMTSGQYQHMPKPPYTPGLEYAGEVLWRGSEAAEHGISVGEAVYVDGLLSGPRSIGAYQQWGGFASYAVAPLEAVRPIPSGLSFDEACCLLGNYETAYHCLVARGNLQAGEVVLIHGASGATGLAAVQLAKQLGAIVIATGRSDEKLAVVKAHGADHVLNIRSTDGSTAVRRFRDDVKAITSGQGVAVVYDGVGGEVSTESLRCMQFGGRFLIVGWAATPFVANGKGQRGAPNANQLPTNLIMMKGLSVLGCPTVISTLHQPTIRPPRLAQIMQWIESGQIRPYISHRFPFAQYKDALRAKWRGEVIGSCVLHL